MAKKDLLERLSQTPSDGLTRRADVTEPGRTEELVQTRVSRKIVRRRPRRESAKKANEEDAVAAKPAGTVRRRRPSQGDAADQDPSATPAEPTEAAATAADAASEPAPVEVAPVPQDAQQPEPEVPAESAEPPAAEAAPEAGEAAAEASAETPAAAEAEPAAEPVAAAPEAPAEKAAADAVPQQPRFEGLGKAVVMPPPGYDPTNPTAWRREQRPPSRPASPASPAAPAAPGAPGAPGADDSAYRGRRRVATGAGDYRDGRRGRRGRTGRGGRMQDGPMRRKGRRKSGGAAPKPSPTPKAIKRKIRVDNVISVSQLAHEMGVKASAVIKELMGMGQMATANEMLDIESATLVAVEFEYQVENVGFQEHEFIPQVADSDDAENLEPRPPVVTIMGHVDHGKTTLLDAIRDARVAQGEAGGITQHIGAYQVEHNEQLITFIDTPGHAAFTEMRARGAGVTDIVVLVVAADDGVQPQTAEAISHSKAAGVPIVVAINKMDKAGVNPETIRTKLSEYELAPEEWGGETLYAEVSALKREGIDDLLEQILLQAELLDITGNPDRHAEGVVIESKMERGRGAVATVLVQKGTLRRNDHVVLGAVHGKVRAMTDHRGKKMKEAGPSTPVEIFGLNDLPEVGDPLTAVKSEKNAKTLAEHRADARRREEMALQRRRTAEDLFALARGESVETLNIILKADVQGSLEAIKAAIQNIEVDGTEVRLLHTGVGPISESDVNLAASDSALLMGFNVIVDSNAKSAASAKGVEPELYDVIYSVLDRVKFLLTGMLEPEFEQIHRGTAEVRAIFRISRVGVVAGSYVQDGVVKRSHSAKLVRDGEALWEGKIDTLKRFKDDVKEVSSGYECGISLEGYDDVHEGDIIETYSLEEIERA